MLYLWNIVIFQSILYYEREGVVLLSSISTIKSKRMTAVLFENLGTGFVTDSETGQGQERKHNYGVKYKETV